MANQIRVMGELIFLKGRREAEAVGAKLETAGFEIFISDHIDDIDGDLPTSFMMVWKDYYTNMHGLVLDEFADAVDVILQLHRNYIGNCGFVERGHVPTKFGDLGNQWHLPRATENNR